MWRLKSTLEWNKQFNSFSWLCPNDLIFFFSLNLTFRTFVFIFFLPMMNFFIFCNFSVEWRWHVMKNKECILTTWFEHIWTSHVCISLWPFDTLPRTRAASPLTANTTPRWSVLSSDDQFFILFFLNISTCWRNNAMRWCHRLRAVNERLTMSPFTFNVTDDVIINVLLLELLLPWLFSVTVFNSPATWPRYQWS